MANDFKTVLTIQPLLSHRSESSSSSSVGNFSIDSNAHSEGRIAKAPKITIGVLDTDVIATDQTSASASELSMNMSFNSVSFSEKATKDAPMIELESVEETKQQTAATSSALEDGPGAGLIPPMSKQMKMGLPTISIEELSKHDTEDDLWTAIDGLVYDITSYAPYHPGGRKIMQGKGKDATAVFRKSHPSPKQALLLTVFPIGRSAAQGSGHQVDSGPETLHRAPVHSAGRAANLEEGGGQCQ